jgi:uncharacterized protein YegP (UPF0339 family)
MWATVVAAVLGFLGVVLSTVWAAGGWQVRERKAIRELMDLSDRTDGHHPAKRPLDEHIAERVTGYGVRAMIPPSWLGIGAMSLTGIALLIAATFVSLNHLQDEEDSLSTDWTAVDRVLAIGGTLLAVFLLMATLDAWRRRRAYDRGFNDKVAYYEFINLPPAAPGMPPPPPEVPGPAPSEGGPPSAPRPESPRDSDEQAEGAREPSAIEQAPSTRYELFRDSSGAYRFRVTASNGELLALSTEFNTQAGAVAAIHQMGTRVGGVSYAITRDRAGGYRVRVTASNGQLLAVSTQWKTRDAALRAVQAMGLTGGVDLSSDD